MEAAFITVPPSTASLAPAKASSFIAAKRPVSRVAGVDLLGRRRSVPPAGEQSCVRTTRVQPKAVQSIDFYNAQEGVGRDDVDIVLPDDVIYKSLRRKAEYMCFHTALELVKEMAGNGIRSPAALTPSPSLSPRDVVQGVLSAMREDPFGGGKVAVQFASESNRFSRCTPQTLCQWLSTSEFKYLLDIASFYVAPVPTFTNDHRACVVSCVIHTSENTRHALSFNVVKAEKSGDAWMIDSVFNS